MTSSVESDVTCTTMLMHPNLLFLSKTTNGSEWKRLAVNDETAKTVA